MPTATSNALTPGQYNVYLPQAKKQQYLAFATLAEAQAAVKAKKAGVILDPAGQLDPSVQTWSGWNSYQAKFPAAVVLNPGPMPGAAQPAPSNSTGPIAVSSSSSTPSGAAAAAPRPLPVVQRFNVWVPPNQAHSLPNTTGVSFINGAYFAFRTAAEAQAEVKRLGFGVILDPQGKPDATQPWGPAVAEAPNRLNTYLAEKRPENQVSVWFPASSGGPATVESQEWDGGAYLAFKSLEEAQAHVTAVRSGIILDAKGKLEATQPWASAATYAAQLLNEHLTAAPTAGKVNVWFPWSSVDSLGVSDTAPFAATGAYLAFNSVEEATAHVKARDLGVLLDQKGHYDTSTAQPWTQALACSAMLLNPQLTATRTPNKHAVWMPIDFVTNLGLTDTKALELNAGAYLAFDSAKEAEAHAKLRTFGVVLDPQGKMAASQPDPNASQYAAELLNPQVKASRTPNKPAVWFSSSNALSLGIKDRKPIVGGAYLAFDSAQEAVAHAKARGYGVILDATGKPDANQPFGNWAQEICEQLNPKLKAAPTANQVSVWFPPQYVDRLELEDSTAFDKAGAYLAFDSVAEAVAHAKARTYGVVLNQQGKLDPTIAQPWNLAAQHGVQLQNAQLTTSRTPNKDAVWIPPSALYRAGLPDPAAFPNGAYLAFDSAQEATAHVQTRSYGVLLDAKGQPAAAQPWNGAGPVIAQLENPKLQTAPTANKVSVWFPPRYIGSLGLLNPPQYPAGAYLSFDSAREAAAHVQSRTFGVVLDAQGKFDPAMPQPWANAGQFGALLLNPLLTPSQTPNKHAVWIPLAHVGGLGLPNEDVFKQGAYLAFNSEQEAVAHVQSRSFGVVLKPNGDSAATQPWTSVGPFLAQRLNGQLTVAPTANKFNVWFPSDHVDNLGLDQGNTTFNAGAYLAFDTAAAAQAHAKERAFGLILNPKGDYDASLQNWKSAPRYAAQLLNPQLKTQPIANKVNAWFPSSALYGMGLADVTPFSKTGAYLAFDSAADAVAHITARNAGAVLNKQGQFDTSVPQVLSLYDYSLLELVNKQLVATRPTKQVSVFFPAEHVSEMGKISDVSAFPNGAYLAFDTAAAALAHTRARGSGVVFNAQGELEPKQSSNASTQLLAQKLNDQLKPTRTPGQVNVWFPKDQVGAMRISDAAPFAANGAYLAFDSLEAAQRHVEARDLGVILDAEGAFNLSSQAWDQAGSYGAQLINGKLLTTKPSSGPYVFFPPKVAVQLGVADTAPYATGGAYLSFATVKEAKDHASARDLGLVYDAKGKYDPANQGWLLAGNYAPLMAMWPPPPVGPEGQTPITGVADIVGVYAKATKEGAHFVVRTHNAQLNEQLKYELYLTVNGSDMKVKDLGGSQMGQGYMHDAAFDVSYAEMNVILGILQGSTVTPGTTAFAVKVLWPEGHDQGASGAGGRGAHRFPAP